MEHTHTQSQLSYKTEDVRLRQQQQQQLLEIVYTFHYYLRFSTHLNDALANLLSKEMCVFV